MTEFASRRCHIKAAGDFEYSELVISFFPLEEKEGNPGDWWACASLDCKYFVKRLEVGGGDGVHALIILLDVVHAFLQGRENRQGYSIWWGTPGDLDDLRLWGASPSCLDR